MAKKKINVMFVLDESGSMMSVKDATISGFNEYVQALRDDNKTDYRFSLLTFNSSVQKLVFDNEKVKDTPLLNDDIYQPAATTPLYDAIARGINKLVGKKNVLFVIQTDGLENASREHDHKDIQKMIGDQTKKGWQFVFLGADQDAWVAGQKIGLAQGQTMSYSSSNTQAAFWSVATASTRYAATQGAPVADFFEGDERDIREK